MDKFASTELDIKGEMKDNISQMVNNNLDLDDLADKKDIPSYADDGIVNTLHTTVLYGLIDDNPKTLIDGLNNLTPVNVTFGKTNYFETSSVEYDVVYLEVFSEEIKKLRKKIQNVVKYIKPIFNYTPHVSLFYVKKGIGKKYKGLDIFEGKTYKFDNLVFSPSEGEDTIILLDKK